jgi:hypothetical protein
MLANTAFEPALMIAECWSDHPAGRWAYVLALHTTPSDDELDGDVAFADLGESAPAGDVVVWDWRARTATRVAADHRWPVRLAREGWAYLVIAPVLDGLAVVGDTSRFVPAGDARIEVAPLDPGPGVRIVAKGAGETVTVTGWADAPPSASVPLRHDAATGVWTIGVAVPSRGWAAVEVRPGLAVEAPHPPAAGP